MKVYDYQRDGEEALAVTLPDEVMCYKMAGYFTQEKEAIMRWLDRGVGEAMKKALRLELELMEQRLLQFPFTEEEALAQIQSKVPDFTVEELRELDEKGLAEWMYIDGEKHYIHNILRNNMRRQTGLARRAGFEDDEVQERQALMDVIGRIRKKGKTTWRFHLETGIAIEENAFEKNVKMSVHLPVPAHLFQIDDAEIIKTSDTAVIDPEKGYWRSVYMERCEEANRPFTVEYKYQVTSVYRDLWSAEGMEKSKGIVYGKDHMDPDTELGEQLPHIHFTPYLRALAKEITAGVESSLEKARAIYDYVTQNVKYSYMQDYLYLKDIPDYCARNLRGDCGVQALLFITLCRICGIPAGWQSGLYVNPYEVGAHDWARFYIEEYGWMFADPSFGGSAYADQDEPRRQFYFGNLDPFRMCANHKFMQLYSKPKRFMPLDPCDNQLGEAEKETEGFLRGQTFVVRKLILAEEV